jgi:hypothetical protein
VLLGLTCAVFIAVGMRSRASSRCCSACWSRRSARQPGRLPRFTFGNAELAGGLTLIPMMIGMFAVSEILRNATSIERAVGDGEGAGGQRLRRHGRLIMKYPLAILRGSTLGTLIGALPGAGADIAAWMSMRCRRNSRRSRRSSAPGTSRDRRGGRGEQQRARGRVDPGARLRHPGRLDHRRS